MIYCIDIDNTLNRSWGKHYEEYVPVLQAINKVNELYDEGHTIKLFSGRGSKSGIDWYGFTKRQLEKWGVKYHELLLGKPAADAFVDDKAINVKEWLGLSSPLLVAVVGAKGVGKTTVLGLLKKRGFTTVANEPYYMYHGALSPGTNINDSDIAQDRIYEEVEAELRDRLTQNRMVAYEATGTNSRWSALIKRLNRDCAVQVVKVESSLASLRLSERNRTNNYPTTPEHVTTVETLSNQIKTNFVVCNDTNVGELDIQLEGVFQKLCGKKLVATGGGFDPLHVGHLELLQRARALGDRLAVILNGNEWLLHKKGYVFMPLLERKKMLEAVRFVDTVVISVDSNSTVARTLELLRPDVYAKGGDSLGRRESDVCERIGCKLVSSLGNKIQSSSSLVAKVRGVVK